MSESLDYSPNSMRFYESGSRGQDHDPVAGERRHLERHAHASSCESVEAVGFLNGGKMMCSAGSEAS